MTNNKFTITGQDLTYSKKPTLNLTQFIYNYINTINKEKSK